MLGLSPAVPPHVRRRHDFPRLEFHRQTRGQVVVQQDDVRAPSVHGQPTTVVRLHVDQIQMPGQATHLRDVVEFRAAHRGQVTGTDQQIHQGAKVLDVSRVSGVRFRVEVNPGHAGIGPLDVLTQQGSQARAVFVWHVVESGGKVVGVNGGHLPACVPDVDAAVDGDGNFRSLLGHPRRQALTVRLNALVDPRPVRHATISSKSATLPVGAARPPSTR